MGITTNNMAQLGVVRQGLMLAWDLGFKFIQQKLDFVIVLSWLTASTYNFPPDVLLLICDCRSLMERAWVVEVRHVYCEADKCADALAKWGNHQQELLTIYDTCPNFVYHCFARDLASLGISRICSIRPDITAFL